MDDRKTYLSVYTRCYTNKLTDGTKYKRIFNHYSFPYDHSFTYNGYFPLEKELELTGAHNQFKDRRSRFQSDTSILNKRKQISAKNNEIKYDKYLNRTHLDLLNEIITESKRKGMHVFFLISPRLRNYKEIHALANHLPDNNIIDISSVEDYPELYKVSNSFDGVHLNEKGAELYTTYIAEVLKHKDLLKK
jgi:hypothetical protein